MRWTAALALLVACGSNGSQGGGSAQIVIDIPNGPLDPKGFTDLDVVLHESGGDVARSAKLGPNMTFDLGDLQPDKAVWVEATLRNDVGAAVAYGRTAVPVAFTNGTEIDVPVRRPIVYIAGLISTEVGQPPPPPNPPTLSWSESPATVSDLSLGG
ncbi:MAG: hypothetical protein JO257_32635, partial [Deltaproteobacteria bacterium]|nr:hypothetical protein [Deltaproteobacteria bacterium]